MENEPLLTTALEYAKLGLPVFPLAKLSKVPLKNTSGFKQATTDEEQIFEWFIQSEPLNIGLSLVDTPYFVVDCDRHTDEQDGLKSLMELSKGEPLLDGAVTVKTPNGIHFYFKQPKGIEIKNQIGFKTGLDIIKNFIVAPPSRVKRKDGTIGTYEVVNGSLDSIKDCPTWLLEAITSNQQSKQPNASYTLNYNGTGHSKRFTAIFIEKIMNGATEGGRNDFFASVIGTLLRQKMDPATAYEFMIHINENFVTPKLPDSEINAVFKSILKREVKKKGVMN